MLAAAQRVRDRADFTEVVRVGRRAGRGCLVVHLLLPAMKHTDEPGVDVPVSGSRAGFIVSKAVGDAVVRNKVRRRLRHLVRPRLASLPAGATLVVRALPAAAGNSSAGLGSDLDAAISAVSRTTSRRPRDSSVEGQVAGRGRERRRHRGAGEPR